MKWLIPIIFLSAVTMIFVFSPQTLRLVKSMWLILQTSPYSQSGSGGGTILVVGDSTAYGTGVYKAKDSIAGRIGYNFPTYRIDTLAKNGRVISEVVPAIQSLNSSVYPDLLLLQVGGNDIIGNHTSETIEADTRYMLKEAKKYAKHVIFMSSGNVGTALFYVKNGQPNLEMERRTLIAREIFMRVATEEGVTYVDLFMPREEDAFLTSPDKYMALDGLHPSASGYDLWYQILLPKLKEVLVN